MYKKTILQITGISAAILLLAGCQSYEKDRKNLTIVAKFTKKAIKMDGQLSDPAWQTTKAYPLLPAPTCTNKEPGWFKVLWSKDYIYVGAKLTDSDIVQENNENEQHHYGSGDVLEVFLKPPKKPFYWEMYCTPNSKRTTMFFPSGGRKLPSCIEFVMPLIVKAKVNGTINNWNDKDKFWTAEMAIPIKTLVKQGAKVNTRTVWRALIARYNYSRWLEGKELSQSGEPKSDRPHFHWMPTYSYLEFRK
jgi:Carbohydrate family 9 binding domain-like